VDAQLPGGSEQRFGYDNAGQLGTLRDLGPAGQVLSSYALGRDAVGSPVRLDSTQGGVSRSDAFSYDPVNRLTGMCYQATSCDGAAAKLSFSYDLVGNRLTRSLNGPGGYTQQYSYDAADQLSFTSGGPEGTVTYAYDADGNQTQAGSTRSSYDLDNKLASVDAGGQKTVYTQDTAGNRVGADTTPDAGSASTHTTYQWDVNNTLPMLAVEQSGSDPARTYTYNPSSSPLTLQVGGTSFLYQPDAFGSTAHWDLRVLNGAYFLSVAGLVNRRRHEARDLDALLTWLADRLPGSYGLLYEVSPDMPVPPGPGAFRVRVLARGQVVERLDPFLSPVRPTIED
jgi:hypothetical protein